MELLFWLFTKHFIADFPLQAHPWFYTNKGTYLHPGGMAHAAIHGFCTFMVVAYCIESFGWAVFAMWVDAVLHYHIDWAKMNVGAQYGLLPNNSEWFWILLGFDQYLHALTYFFLAWMVL